MDIAARAIVDQVIAGEYADRSAGVQPPSVISARLGRSRRLDRLEAVACRSLGRRRDEGRPACRCRQAFLDFLVSEEGQKIFSAANLIPVDPNVPAKSADLKPEVGHFRAIYLTPEELDVNIPKWQTIFKSLFR